MRTIILTLVVLTSLPFLAVGAVPGKQVQSPTAGQSLFSLRLRVRKDTAVQEEKVDWDASKTAVIVCDMWDKHWCKGATRRVGEIAPHLNALLKTAREKGALIIHAPSSCMDTYKDHPARKRATGAPQADDVPEFLRKGAAKLETERDAVWPIDQKDGGCDCQPVCKQGQPWKSQIDAIEIADADAITDSGVETWNLLAARKIDNVLLTGVHTNMCVIGRPFGLRNLKRAGKNVVLVRDLTDTMYNSRRRPKVSHFRGTELIVAYIEQFVCPTAISTDITAAAPSQFSSDKRPHIVFLLGEREYRTTTTVPAFAEAYLAPAGFRCTYIHAASHNDATRKHDFPGFDAVRSADLLFVSIRRRGLKPEQLDLIRAHLDAGKPLVGIRTASHAFHTRGKHPKGHAEWETFDPEVLGGNYAGHHGPKHQPTITLAPAAKDHPILRGVKPFPSGGSLYKVRPLAKSATPLLIGTIPDAPPEPVAWTHTHKKARIFATSLGHWDDFQNPHFLRLLTNAIHWATETSR
jgi:nicotinamidase-related amidase/type 1 glutamine amidotransferase